MCFFDLNRQRQEEGKSDTEEDEDEDDDDDDDDGHESSSDDAEGSTYYFDITAIEIFMLCILFILFMLCIFNSFVCFSLLCLFFCT